MIPYQQSVILCNAIRAELTSLLSNARKGTETDPNVIIVDAMEPRLGNEEPNARLWISLGLALQTCVEPLSNCFVLSF